MSDFLDRLERALTEAIERREAEPARGWRRWRPPPRVSGVLVGLAMALLVVGVGVVALVARDSDEEVAIPLPAKTVPEPARPVPAGTALKLRGNVERIDSTAWRGQVDGPGGTGTLVLAGPTRFSAHCCEFPPKVPEQVITFEWTAPGGALRGCIQNVVLRRPNGRWVWDGPGRVIAASGTLRRYEGADIALGGETKVNTPNRTLIVMSNDARPPGDC